jgi:hypothetical protein
VTTAGLPAVNAPRARWVGGLLLVHFIIVVWAKTALGRPQELAWISHVGLLMTALGFLLRADLLIAGAFVGLAGLHGIWLFDAAGGLLGGRFPLGATRYLATAGPLEWLSTLHHFYLLPLLTITVYRRRCCPPAAYLVALTLFVYLSVLSRAFFAPADNINYAFGVEVHVAREFLARVHRQPGWFYLLSLNAFVAIVLLLPPFLAMRLCLRRPAGHLPSRLPRAATTLS